MSLPIRETPVLTGKDAIRFRKRMEYVDKHGPSKKDKADYKRAKKVFETCIAAGHDKDFLP